MDAENHRCPSCRKDMRIDGCFCFTPLEENCERCGKPFEKGEQREEMDWGKWIGKIICRRCVENIVFQGGSEWRGYRWWAEDSKR